ncbi:signaling threshold-regulating transmembrane adapter 1 [Ornithorhynchus anatinus]|uniref:signaling threshold-regulating transmembrane adapter 1 n=1 Tax=Ornithorhynchus anatinus TaxID=9258 RepID=UPI0010A858ED|nr:signaling threshold-regulating transmembrane adapter 1 [Ornithorhynchus anatinus]
MLSWRSWGRVGFLGRRAEGARSIPEWARLNPTSHGQALALDGFSLTDDDGGMETHHPRLTTTSSSGNSSSNCFLIAGIPCLKEAWVLWGLFGVMALLFLLSLIGHLARWVKDCREGTPEPGRVPGFAEEVPLYGNLPYLQTGRLPKEPDSNLQEPQTNRKERAGEELLCYASLRGQSLAGPAPASAPTAGPSPAPALQYSDVVMGPTLEPATDPRAPREPELYASVDSQKRCTAFPDQDYANSHCGLPREG